LVRVVQVELLQAMFEAQTALIQFLLTQLLSAVELVLLTELVLMVVLVVVEVGITPKRVLPLRATAVD
jgi:hypothetical protein